MGPDMFFSHFPKIQFSEINCLLLGDLKKKYYQRSVDTSYQVLVKNFIKFYCDYCPVTLSGAIS